MLFSKLVRTTKPTGSGKCPPYVKRAHALERLLNERAGTQDLDDSDIENDADDDDENDDNDQHQDNRRVHKVTIRSVSADNCKSKSEDSAPPRRGGKGAQSMQIMQKLAGALDPEVQRDRDDQRASRSLQNTHILTLSQQLRDSQATNERLRIELDNERRHVHQLERSLDRIQMRLDFTQGSRPKARYRKANSDTNPFTADWSESDKENWFTFDHSTSSTQSNFSSPTRWSSMAAFNSPSKPL